MKLIRKAGRRQTRYSMWTEAVHTSETVCKQSGRYHLWLHISRHTFFLVLERRVFLKIYLKRNILMYVTV